MTTRRPSQPDIQRLDTTQAAHALGVNPATVTAWIRDGKLKGSIKDDKGRWLVKRSEIERILATRGMSTKQQPSHWIPITDRKGRHA